jgi:DNA-binding MarR family transcriptional regulator
MTEWKHQHIPFSDNPVSNVFLLAKRAFKAMDGFQRKILAELDLTSAQFSILSHLWEKDQIPFKELAARCFCTRPTVTGIVDSLEKKGLVKRTNNSQDRRSLLVELTPEGHNLELKAPKLDKMFSKRYSSMNSDDLAKLEELLKKFLQELELPM